MFVEPDYLPDEILSWARDRHDVLDLVVGELLRTGVWPTTTGLTRDLARAGKAVPLSAILRDMPRPLGFVENQPGRIVLLLCGLRLTSEGERLVDGFVSLLKLARERYQGPDETPTVTRADLAQIGLADSAEQQALNEIFLREAPFFSGGPGGPEDEWTREVAEIIVHYWDVDTADDYLRIRTRELGMSPQFGFTPPASTTERPADHPGEMRDVFISHASEDKDDIAHPLADALLASGYSVWFDEYELVLGSSLRESIEQGIARSRLGVVILSEAFFEKRWPQQELNGLYARLVGGERNVIVPIWHGLTREDVARYAPTIADLLAGNSADGVEKLVNEVGRTLARRSEFGAERPAAPAAQPVLAESANADSQAVETGPVAGRRPALGAVNFDMEAGALNIAALELVRDDDTIALQHMFNDAIARAREAIENDQVETSLVDLLDKLICLAATFLALGQDQWVDMVVSILARIYSMPMRDGDARRFAYNTQIPPSEVAPRVWLAIIERIYSLGALSVRLEKWDMLRTVSLQHPKDVSDYERNWLRHALTMAARAGHLRERRDDRNVELSLLSLARDQIARLNCLRSDGLGPDDDEIMTSLAQFDVLSNIVAVDGSGDASGRDFYPHFARFYSHRVIPIVKRLLNDSDMHRILFTRDDGDLAIALESIGTTARKEGWSFDGFDGWGPEISEFIAANLPAGPSS